MRSEWTLKSLPNQDFVGCMSIDLFRCDWPYRRSAPAATCRLIETYLVVDEEMREDVMVAVRNKLLLTFRPPLISASSLASRELDSKVPGYAP